MAMIAVIFESWPTNAQKYIDMGEALRSQLQTLDGFISIERFRSVSDPAKLVALSFWRDEVAVERWRNNEFHRLIQAKSRQEVFRDYRLRVAAVLRDYGMFERDQAPQDSLVAHERRKRDDTRQTGGAPRESISTRSSDPTRRPTRSSPGNT
jgi:heme-degrading monooxygenase HmoA